MSWDWMKRKTPQSTSAPYVSPLNTSLLEREFVDEGGHGKLASQTTVFLCQKTIYIPVHSSQLYPLATQNSLNMHEIHNDRT